MDKYEYKIRTEEIRSLIAEGNYEQAAQIADTIDWRRVKSVMMLCTISDLYKINRRFEDARDLLLLAYEKRPGGRTICYSLCELCLKIGDYVQAVEYYKEYVQAAPRDPGRYVLLYKIYEAQDVGLEERIKVLEELKKEDYREKWAYELAYLYHRVGLVNKCVETCDELFLWFGSGRYVYKAMELKMLHEPLTQAQSDAYEHRFDAPVEYAAVQESEPDTKEDSDEKQADEVPAEKSVRVVMPDSTGDTRIFDPKDLEKINRAVQSNEIPEPEEELDIQVKTMDVGEYNTINLQAELAAGLKEVLDASEPETEYQSKDSLFATRTVYDAQESVEPDYTQETVESDYAQESVEPGYAQETGETAYEADTDSLLPHEETKRGTQNIENVLAQEADGQIRMVVPSNKETERQITGQMAIEDILAEWERMKKQSQERHQEEVRQHVLEQTGEMFTAFEASIRDGLLEKLEKEEDIPEEDQTPSEDAFYEEPQQAVIIEEETEKAAYMPEPGMEVSEAADLQMELEKEDEFEDEIAEETEELAEIEELEEVEETEELAEIEELEETEEIAETEELAEIEELEETEELAEAEELEETEEVAETEELAEIEETEEVAETEELAEIEELEEVEETEEPAEAEELEEVEETEEPAEAEEAEEIEETEAEHTEEEADARADADSSTGRKLSPEEQELYEPYVYTKKAREALVVALDAISMAPYTGNLSICGEEGMDILGLAKKIAGELQNSDSNFTGKVAKISGQNLNKKNISDIMNQLSNGALIIERVSGLNAQTANEIHKELQQENRGIIVIILDTKKKMKKFLAEYSELAEGFTARITLEPLSDETLAAIGIQYAREKEFSIDTLGILALHTRIDELQTSDHAVNAQEVKLIVDEAIKRAKKKSVKHFCDVLFGRRYDDEDMIVLGEKDFA